MKKILVLILAVVSLSLSMVLCSGYNSHREAAYIQKADGINDVCSRMSEDHVFFRTVSEYIRENIDNKIGDVSSSFEDETARQKTIAMVRQIMLEEARQEPACCNRNPYPYINPYTN